jgi:hypothetical protein
VHDGSITIFEEVFNLLSYIYVKNKGFPCWGIFVWPITLHACSPQVWWIIFAQDNISVEVEYFYSLQVKTRSFYNFTQS